MIVDRRLKDCSMMESAVGRSLWDRPAPAGEMGCDRRTVTAAIYWLMTHNKALCEKFLHSLTRLPQEAAVLGEMLGFLAVVG